MKKQKIELYMFLNINELVDIQEVPVQFLLFDTDPKRLINRGEQYMLNNIKKDGWHQELGSTAHNINYERISLKEALDTVPIEDLEDYYKIGFSKKLKKSNDLLGLKITFFELFDTHRAMRVGVTSQTVIEYYVVVPLIQED